MEVKVNFLYKNEHVSLVDMQCDELDLDNFPYAHESKGSGAISVVLPYRFSKNDRLQLLLRKEIVPCWGFKHQMTSISGPVLEASARGTAVRELREDSGYRVHPDKDLLSLGKSYGHKIVDTICHLYATDLTNVDVGEDLGDHESKLRAGAIWLDGPKTQDPLVYIMYVRLLDELKATMRWNKNGTISLENADCPDPDKSFLKMPVDM